MEGLSEGLGPAARAVLFDLDGTLLDAMNDMSIAFHKLLVQEPPGGEFPVAPLTRDELIVLASQGCLGLLPQKYHLAAEPGKDMVQSPDFLRLRSIYWDFFRSAGLKHAHLFPQVRELIEELDRRAIPWGIVTNKWREDTETALKFVALQPKIVVCPDDVQLRTKPEPDGLLLGCQQLGQPVQQTLYVGDSAIDAEAASACRMPFALVDWGWTLSDRSDWSALGKYEGIRLSEPGDVLTLVA